MSRKTTVSIHRQSFLINGRPTYEGRSWRGMRIEGLLMNSRMVQGIFDDLNPETRSQWDYPDGPFDAERNVREFLAAMPEWRRKGLLSLTINLQGGTPRATRASSRGTTRRLSPTGRCAAITWAAWSACSTGPTNSAWRRSWDIFTSVRIGDWPVTRR